MIGAVRRALRLQDVAEAAGVSLATASRSLSGSNGVSPALAARVRAVADELGYVANIHARSLAGGSTSSIGLVVHEIGDPYFTEIAAGVMDVGEQHGLMVQVRQTRRDPDHELAQIRALVANRVDGILIAGSGYVDPRAEQAVRRQLEAFRSAGGRVAVIGRHHLGVDAVLPDNIAGGRTIAEHLLELGHRRVAILAGSRGLTTIADRLAGIAEAVEAAGGAPEDWPVIEAAFTRQGGKDAALRLLDDRADVTAVIALNDDMAIGALSVLRASGVSVPGDMSVAGFDDIEVATDIAPSLTTVRLPMREMGELALSLALSAPAARPRRRTTGHQLMVRDSTAAPRSQAV